MVKDSHAKAVSYFLRRCQKLAVVSILTYGSYARGDYRPDSDIDLLVVLDSGQYSSKDLRSLVKICKFCREKFEISFQMDIMLDSEIELWNEGILLEGHSFIDVFFYKKDGKVLLGKDVRNRFKLPQNIEDKARILLGIIEAEFKRWFLEGEGKRRYVPHWMTGWLLVTFLNALGVVDITSFEVTCESIEEIPLLAKSHEFNKYKCKKELTSDEFIKLCGIIKNYCYTKKAKN